MRLLVIFILLSSVCFPQIRQASISGKVINKSTNRPVINCNAIITINNRGTVTDSSGHFILYIPEGKYLIKFSHVGFKTVFREIDLRVKSYIYDLLIELEPSLIEEDLVTVIGNKQKSTVERQKLDSQDIRNMPNLYSDPLRSIQILPGVTSNNELSSSYNVRGGNFDENLVYLNGFQIFKPFMLKQGVEENQTLINPDMLKDMQFFAGGFPARLGDKMSSALEITYMNEFQDSIRGNLKADLMNFAGSFNHHYKNLNYIIGARYANPGLFLNKLHTTGSYMPYFADIQALLNYNISQNTAVELLLISASNKFKFSPYEFQGNFQQAIPKKDSLPAKYIRGIKIMFEGNNSYSFNTNFAGLKLLHHIPGGFKLVTALSVYHTNEKENGNTSSDLYYSDSPDFGGEHDYIYLKSRKQFSDNSLFFISGEGQIVLSGKISNHNLMAGLTANLIHLKNNINENSYETSSLYMTDFPDSRNINTSLRFNSYSIYIQDETFIYDNIKLNAGIRFLYYDYTNEKLFSPRASLIYYPSAAHTLNFSWGYYYQPPFYYELRNKLETQANLLKSQKAIFYVFGWDYFFKEKVKFQIQTYYKSLDNLIPYYIEQLKLEYGGRNNMEGYAYGIDLQFQGEITSNVQSWIGYSYLDSKERYKNGSYQYQRRFLDQSHTIQIFLQDKFPKHQNWQSHLRLLFGSGFLYPERKASLDPSTGKQYVSTVMDQRAVFPFYMRADMGLTAYFKILNKYQIKLIAEVLNIFDKKNIANYIWMQTFKEIKQPMWIPQLYSKRFFNIGMEFTF
ncbi:MAG: TonB-dependent receptor [Bacillota bacterium]